MCKYSSFCYHLNPQKLPKTHKMTTKYYKYHWNVFLCDSDTKILKTSEKHTKYTKVSLSVPELPKLAKLVPELSRIVRNNP